jgi:CHASE2 domain-containing sensor protein
MKLPWLFILCWSLLSAVIVVIVPREFQGPVLWIAIGMGVMVICWREVKMKP